ncbi:hypothetical protein BJ878DRAFT_523556 [Calycina marina]|uniref:Major facilitator superfamily (MFS) profile domain-containing protein n=1 Tax=Calycina marina TaxID=1763456 RepID=A0A9P8CBG6_9HELO|nr:hypothetical protein BJ878DRAFT_523556 [Calycina marina]
MDEKNSPAADPPGATSKEYSNELEHNENGNPLGHQNMEQNLAAKIRNPLVGIPRAKLMEMVETFAAEKGIDEVLLLKKGALVAQDPENYEDLTGEFALSPEEIRAIRDEVEHKWKQPKQLYLTIFTCSIGAAVQGWDQTGSNGANLSFPEVFGIGGTSNHDTLIVGLVNAAPYIASAFFGCWIADPLNHYFGRRGTIFFAGIFCFLPVLGSAFTQTWPELFICRLLLGIGMGSKGSTVPVYAAENSPPSIRGALVMSWQLWTAFGIMLGNAANLAFVHVGKNTWRLQLGSAIVPAIPLLILIYLCPESPRWYIKKNRYIDAFKSLKALRNDPILAARDLYFIYSQLQIESYNMGTSNYASRFKDLFFDPRIRRATMASFTVMIAQQMCGINIIAFYSSTIFANSGFSTYQALWASFGFGVINFLFAFPALYTIDTFGRRSLLLFTFPNMAWSLLAAGLCALIPTGNAQLALVAMFIYIFAMFYSPGEGPVPFAYSAEVFPLSHREIGMGWAVATCLFWAAVLTMFLPLMLDAMGTTGVFCFYAGTNIVALCMIYLFVPETKQRTLEQLDYIFATPTKEHIKYHNTKSVPYFVRRYIRWDKSATLEPLFSFEGADSDTDKGRKDALHANDLARAERNKNAAKGMPESSSLEGDAITHGGEKAL